MYLNKLFWMSPYRCTKMLTLFPFFSIYILTFYTVHNALVSHKTVILLYKKYIWYLQPREVLKVSFQVHLEKSKSI